MIVSACLCLALAAVCMPGPSGPGRLPAVAPSRSGRAGWRARQLPMVTVAAAPAAVAGYLAAGAGGALAGAVIATTIRRRRRARAAGAVAAATAGEVADALRRITDELRTGAHPAAALEGVSADGPLARAVLADAAAAARMSDDVPRALRRSAARQPAMTADLNRLADSWTLADRHGIPLADLLAGAHADISWRVQYGHRIQAQLAGPRATAVVLTALPALGLLLGQLLGADPLGVLRSSLLGQVLLVVGVGLTAAGFAWSDRILRSAVPR